MWMKLSAVVFGMDRLYRIAVKRLPESLGGLVETASLLPGAQLTDLDAGNHSQLILAVAPNTCYLPAGSALPRSSPWRWLLVRAGQGSAALRVAAPARPREPADEFGIPVAIAWRSLSARTAGGSILRRRLLGCGPMRSSFPLVRSACWRGRPSANGRIPCPVDELRFETFGNSGRFAAEAFKVKIRGLAARSTVR